MFAGSSQEAVPPLQRKSEGWTTDIAVMQLVFVKKEPQLLIVTAGKYLQIPWSINKGLPCHCCLVHYDHLYVRALKKFSGTSVGGPASVLFLRIGQLNWFSTTSNISNSQRTICRSGLSGACTILHPRMFFLLYIYMTLCRAGLHEQTLKDGKPNRQAWPAEALPS